MADSSSSVDRPAAEAMLRAMHEHQVGSSTADLAVSIHPEAEMRLLVSFNRLLKGREAILAALESGRQAQIFQAQVERFEWLDEHATLTFARARYALEQGGYAEGRVVWLDEVRDGLIWRVRNFRHEAEARQAYESGEDIEAGEV